MNWGGIKLRSKILDLLREHRGEYISGEEISQQLGVSRTAIWKHMRALKQQGYNIESHSRLGYCLRQTPDRLLPAEIGAKLSTTIIGQEIHYFDELDSTNNQGKKLAINGCPEGTIVVAEAQNTGRGRLARGWFSPSGQGIWLSIVLRPPLAPKMHQNVH
jgi:BirA family biotin operon repressor/biotin-[acetyl-CoA-carboxylase] ligase